MAYLHSEPNVIVHRDLKPRFISFMYYEIQCRLISSKPLWQTRYFCRNVLLVNSSADHLKVGDFGLSKLIRVKHSHDVYKMTGETGSCEYIAIFQYSSTLSWEFDWFLIMFYPLCDLYRPLHGARSLQAQEVRQESWCFFFCNDFIRGRFHFMIVSKKWVLLGTRVKETVHCCRCLRVKLHCRITNHMKQPDM